jgi:hypothetical protein
MPVGDINSNERGSGARFNDGKPPMELIPLSTLAGNFKPATSKVVRALAGFARTRSEDDLWAAYGHAEDLIPGEEVFGELLEIEARVFGYGAKKYAAWNWTKGMPWSVPVACIIRHLVAIERDELNDPESGLPHAGHIACNIRMLAFYLDHYPEGDDLFPPREIDDGDLVTVAGVQVPASDLG